MKKVLKYGVFSGLAIAVFLLLWKYYKCQKKGDASGKMFECGLFRSEPNYIEPGETDYRTSEGKCYEVTEYGKKMSYREVDAGYCR